MLPKKPVGFSGGLCLFFGGWELIHGFKNLFSPQIGSQDFGDSDAAVFVLQCPGDIFGVVANEIDVEHEGVLLKRSG